MSKSSGSDEDVLALLLVDADPDFPFTFFVDRALLVPFDAELGVRFRMSHFVSATLNCRSGYVVSRYRFGLLA
jgi:hypothetical protein